MNTPPAEDHTPGPSIAQPKARYRIKFSKVGALRFTSHLDLARIWERSLRRAGVPLAYSQGFNPRPQLQLAAALPLGYESDVEIIDMWTEGDLADLAAVHNRIQEAVPDGLRVSHIEAVELKGPALQTLTTSATYLVELSPSSDIEALQRNVRDLLAQASELRIRRDREYDLRPLIYELILTYGTPPVLEMVLALSQDRGTGRPDEVLDALGIDPNETRIRRIHIDFGDQLR